MLLQLNHADTAHRVHGIDALRGLAAAGVLIVHAVAIRPLGVTFNDWHVGYLVLGVPLFFMISAFSMAFAYPGGIMHPGRSRSYAIRRLLRIAPLFYLMLALWIIYLKYLGSPFPKITTLLMNISFFFGLSPKTQVSLVPAGWSIGNEMVFYALFPLIWLRPGIRAASTFLFVSLAGAWVLNQPGSAPVSDYFYWCHFATNLPYFAVGLVVWWVHDQCPKEKQRPLAQALLASSLVLTICLYLYGPDINGRQTLSEPVPLQLILGWALAFGLLVLSQALAPFWLLANPFTRFLGKISYSLYLSHPLLIYATGISVWAASLAPGPALVVPMVALVTLSAAIPLAWILYLFVEAPFIRLGRRLTSGPVTDATPPR